MLGIVACARLSIAGKEFGLALLSMVDLRIPKSEWNVQLWTNVMNFYIKIGWPSRALGVSNQNKQVEF